MSKKYFIQLAAYNAWADNIAIEWLNQINDEQWNQVITSSFNSIRQTAIHIAGAEKIWIDFYKSVPDPVYLSAGFNGTKNDLTAIWKKASTGLKTFIEEYPEEDYMQQITLIKPGGQVDKMEFSLTFPHIINHTTYHRGQLVTLLRQVGFTNFSSTDLFTYYRMMQK